MGASLIKKEAITGYEDLEIDLYQDKRLEEKKTYGLSHVCMI